MYHLEKQELQRLFQAAYDRNRDHHAALLTCFWHACRVSELLSIRGVNVHDGLISIRRLKGAGKKGKKRHKTTLQAIHRDSDPLFDESPMELRARENPMGRMFPFCRQRMDQVIKHYGALAGLHPDKCHTHVLRHSLAVLLWRETHELSAVQATLGHWSPSSSLIYMQTDATAKANAVLAKGFSAGE